MKVTIDENSGYCFGVEYAIEIAEYELKDSDTLYCLGDIVHNSMEVDRLYKKGLRIINYEQLKGLKNCKVLIRAHGEPPETYKIALENNIALIDASCPVVLKLQNRVKHSFDKISEDEGQIVIYGKHGHAEVIGLAGQTKDKAIIISSEEDIDNIDFTKPISLYSQTTKSTKGFYKIKKLIEEKIREADPDGEIIDFEFNDSICRQVSNREPQLQEFARLHDVILFVSGKKSSNGKSLYSICKSVNPNSYFVENESEIDTSWFSPDNSVGICGATSTPGWLMKRIADYIEKIDVAILVL